MKEAEPKRLGSEFRPWTPLAIMLWASNVPLKSSALRALLSTIFTQAPDRLFRSIPVKADQYDLKFFCAVGSVLAFTLVAYWLLTDYWDVKWFAGEDGVSEWWSVATYLASAAMAMITALFLRQLGHPLLGTLHFLFAAALLVGALEEISWGQRLFGWSTPAALSGVNQQGETTFHNVTGFSRVFPTLFFWASALALIGAIVRAILHHHRRVTTADFVLPSLVLSPALLMSMFWIGGAQSLPGNIARIVLTHFGLDPMGSEIPEVLIGLCLCLYTYANLRRARALRSRQIMDQVAYSS